MTVTTGTDWPTFIRDHTRVLTPPLVPEISLHLAEETVPLWQKTEEELGRIGLPPPFWAFAWAGGQALARYLLDNPEVARGKTVIDLGAGSGLAGIAAMKAGARKTLAADIDPIALAAVGINATLNDVTLSTTADDVLETGTVEWGLVLVADVFYERQLAERVLGFIAAAVAGGAVALVGDPRRSYFPAERFRRIAEYRVPVTRELEDSEIKSTAVWSFVDPRSIDGSVVVRS